jgi:hypothetical protein
MMKSRWMGPKLALLLLVGLSLLACGAASRSGPEPTVTPEATAPPAAVTPAPTNTLSPALAIIGTWVQHHTRDESYVRFDVDGTFRGASLQRNLERLPKFHGRYEVDGLTLTLTLDDGGIYCQDEVAVYRLVFDASGRFATERIRAVCHALQASISPRIPWEPVQAEGE